MPGHGDGVEAGLLRSPPVHPIEQGMGQALGDEVGDHQHIGPGKIRLLELYQRLLAAGWLEGSEQQLFVSQEGRLRLQAMGLYIDALAPGQPRDCVICHCSEWSDQGPHLGGSLGQALLKLFVQSGWVREQEGSRAVHITPLGLQQINGIASLPARQVG